MRPNQSRNTLNVAGLSKNKVLNVAQIMRDAGERQSRPRRGARRSPAGPGESLARRT
jgi:hypothetical protein